MSTISYNDYQQEYDDYFFWDYSNIKFEKNYSDEQNVIVDQQIQPIENQLGSSAIFNQDISYDQNFNLNNNNNNHHYQHQDLTKHFDTYRDNIPAQSPIIDLNCFNIDNFCLSPLIFSLMKDYENLSSSPISHLFQNDLQQHANTTTIPSIIAKNNRHQTTRMISFLESNHLISTTNTIIPIDDDADNDDNGTINNFIRPILFNDTSTRTSDINDISELIMMPMVNLTSTTTLTSSISSTSMTRLIAEHDRPFSDYGHLNHEKILRKCRFDLAGIKTNKKRRLNNNRMARQMYAITCWTDIAQKHIMNEICWQFPVELLQYACVSMDYSESMATFRTIYIQIILKRVINKTGWFLDKITGDKCNYHVTDNDLAWNEYIKKDRLFIENGLFKSKRARSHQCDWSTSAFVRAQKRKN